MEDQDTLQRTDAACIELDPPMPPDEDLNDSGLLPMEYHVVIKPDALETVSPGGIILRTAAISDRDKLAVEEGILIAMSPMAFTYADWPKNARKPKSGDRVMFKRYAGLLRERNGREYRVIIDRDIVAIIEE